MSLNFQYKYAGDSSLGERTVQWNCKIFLFKKCAKDVFLVVAAINWVHGIFVVFLNERRKISCRGFTRHRNVLSTTNPPPMTRNAAGECYRFINMCTTLNIPSNGASILNFSLHTSIYCLSSPICDSSQFSRSLLHSGSRIQSHTHTHNLEHTTSTM